MKTDRSKTKTLSLNRDHSKEKGGSPKGQSATLMQSIQSKSIKSANSGERQNFNTYRHVITNNTTADDISWIANLRNVPRGFNKIR